jgi:hypothetical protein
LFKWDEFGHDDLELDGTAKEGKAEPKAGKAEVPFKLVPPGRYNKGGMALKGSIRAMAKQPVQRRSKVLVAWENW